MGSRATPSCVAFDAVSKAPYDSLPSGFQIGDPAYNQKERNVEGTLLSFKRLLGKSLDSEEVQEDLESMKAYKYVKLCSAGPEGIAFELPYEAVRKMSNGSTESRADASDAGERKSLDLETVAALVLGKVRETAELYLGEKVEHAVLSVPGHFSPVNLLILR